MSTWIHVRQVSDVRLVLRGHALVTTVAMGCLAFTSATSTVLHAGVVAIAGALRRDLDTGQGALLSVEPAMHHGACPLFAEDCPAPREYGDAPMVALRRSIDAERRRGEVALVGEHRLGIHTRNGVVSAHLVGTDAALFGLQTITVWRGRLWHAADERSGRPVAIVGRQLFDTLVWHGHVRPATHGPHVSWWLRLPGQRLRALEVIGIVESSAMATVDVDRAVVVPYAQFQRLTGTRAPPSRIVGLRDGRGASPTLLDAWRRIEHRVPRWAGTLSMTSTEEQLGDVAKLEGALRGGVRWLSVILVLAAVAAVAALMVTIARAHARTVGIARALGATRRAIAAQGALLGALFGGAGALLGSLVAWGLVALLPVVSDLPSPDAAAMALACVRGAVPPLLVAVVAGVATFARLAWARPAALLG